MKILLTGSAGFIGYHTAIEFAAKGYDVYAIDSINDYYDVDLKYGRLHNLGFDKENISGEHFMVSNTTPNLRFRKMDISDGETVQHIFRQQRFDMVCHLAAQAGVRYSIENPYAYADANLTGFLNILEGCRQFPVQHLVYASSSSVYGLNTSLPFTEQQQCDSPASFYAATKKSNELMAFSYGKLYGIRSTGLRFFTVYGPWGRPDMAPYIFTDKISRGLPIEVFNNGDMSRDFTYIDDIVNGMVTLQEFVPTEGKFSEIYNIGASAPVNLNDFIGTVEQYTGKKAIIVNKPMQQGDVKDTYADITKLREKTGYDPRTSLDTGIRNFVEWYNSYYETGRS